QTMENYKNASLIYSSLNLPQEIITINTNIGMVYARLGNYNKAVNYYYEAIRFLEKSTSPNLHNLANTYNSLGLVYRNIKDYPSAINAFKKSIDIFVGLNDSLSLAGGYVNYGTVFRNQNQLDSAKTYFLKALFLANKLNNQKLTAV